MSYFDVMVAAVPEARKAEYVAYAKGLHAIFREVGATSIIDTWGEDVPDGKLTDFRKAVQAGAGEAVAVGWVVWPDKSTRDAGWDTLMKDERMKPDSMPFDGKRMIWGGFALVAES